MPSSNENKLVALQCEALAREISKVAGKYECGVFWATMAPTVAALWCNRRNVTTVTEAVDQWRAYAALIEPLIRECFGAVRYGQPSDEFKIGAFRGRLTE